MTSSQLMEKSLQSGDRTVRLNALKDLLKLCEGLPVVDCSSSLLAIELYDQYYLDVLNCYTDKYENCRTVAVEIVSSILPKLPKNDFYLDCILPVLTRRIGQKELIEESEEIRLLLVQQLFLIISGQEMGNNLTKSMNDIIDILWRTLKDPFPLVQRESCNVLVAVADQAPTTFHIRSEHLVDPLIAMLQHRHSASRIAAVKALGVLTLHIHNGEIIIKIITSISPLLMDAMPYVRRECGQVGCRWLLELKDRYSFFERILPLIFCCLKDDTQEVRQQISEEWIKCGEQYFQENENELNKLELVDYIPKNYPQNVCRPTLGCRRMCQRSLRMIQIVVRELTDWKEDVRLHSLKLLWQVVLHSEQALNAKFIDIYPVLAKCCADKDTAVAAEAVRVSELIGKLLNIDSWIDYALKEFEKSPNLGFLKCVSALYGGSDNAAKLPFIIRIAKVLTSPTICHSLNEDYQAELLNLIEIIVDLTVVEDESEKLFYTLLIKIIALETTKSNKSKGVDILKKIAGQQELSELHVGYLADIIRSIDDLDSENTEFSENILLVHGLIWNCGFRKEYLEAMTMAIIQIMENATPNGRIKIYSAISVAALNWSQTVTKDDSTALLRKFIDDIIVPSLQWRAGRIAESIRSMAVATLYSMTMGATNETFTILPDLINHFQLLVEDNCVVTRAYSVRCLLNCGPITFEKFKPLALAVLARLDDASIEVREYAAQCIGTLQATVAGDEDLKSFKSVILYILSKLLLHLDCPEIKLQEILLDSIMTIGKRYNDELQTAIADLPKSFVQHRAIEQLLIQIS